MAEKAKKKDNKKDNKNLIIGICAGVVVIIVVIVAIILATRGPQINDDYFVTDDTKYVVTMENGDGVESPAKIHYVYTHSGDKITGAAMYGEFNDADAAKAAFEEYRKENEDLKNTSVNGKYIVIKSEDDEFEDYTIDDIKSLYEYDFDYEEDEE